MNAATLKSACGREGGQTVGIDIGDRFSHFCVIDEEGNVTDRGRVRTLEEDLSALFKPMLRARIAIETGTHSGWIARLLEQFQHEVIVANAREVKLITRSNRKNDRVDAEKPARLARVDPLLLKPVTHRSEKTQLDLAKIKMRDRLVVARAMLINAVRGLVKSFGHRLPDCAAKCFAKRCETELEATLKPIVLPLITQIQQLTDQIKVITLELERMATSQYPETAALRQVVGVGSITALSFVLTLGSKERFRSSRDVGAYLGLRPKQRQSGDRDPQLRITKAGDSYLRKTLVQCAQYILGRFGPDCNLKRWGTRLAGGGKGAKKRAVVAVARKLSILLHRLWVTQEPYDPFHGPAVAASV